MALKKLLYDKSHLYSIDALTAHLYFLKLFHYISSFLQEEAVNMVIYCWRNRFYQNKKCSQTSKDSEKKHWFPGKCLQRHNRSFFVGAKALHIHSRLWFISAIFLNWRRESFCQMKRLVFRRKSIQPQKIQNLIFEVEWLE